jgi:hypothetical protein
MAAPAQRDRGTSHIGTPRGLIRVSGSGQLPALNGVGGSQNEERRSARGLIARVLQERAAEANVDLPAPAEQLAVAVLALSNGIAIEHLADPEAVDASTFGVILRRLLDGLVIPSA